jgi:Flp pilus assembly pilin Flp
MALHSRVRSIAGQGLAEYALILSLIAILVVGVLMFLGTNVQTIISKIATKI